MVVQDQHSVDVVNVNELIKNQDLLNKTENNILMKKGEHGETENNRTTDDIDLKSSLRNEIVLDQ